MEVVKAKLASFGQMAELGKGYFGNWKSREMNNVKGKEVFIDRKVFKVGKVQNFVEVSVNWSNVVIWILLHTKYCYFI